MVLTSTALRQRVEEPITWVVGHIVRSDTTAVSEPTVRRFGSTSCCTERNDGTWESISIVHRDVVVGHGEVRGEHTTSDPSLACVTVHTRITVEVRPSRPSLGVLP